MAQDYDNSILVTKNESANEKAPLYRVNITLNGEKYVAGLWVRSHEKFISANNPKGSYMSGQIEPDTYKKDAPKKASKPVMDVEDDIPFNRLSSKVY